MESPVAVEVYDHHFLKKNPVASLFESLQLINGIRPQVNCGICQTGDIRINGLDGPYTMVTIDGMPIVSGLSTVYGLSGIPTQLIERIEVVKGPASTLYGSEAVGGLINIITRSVKSAPVFSADVMTNSWRERQVDLTGAVRHKKLHGLFGVHHYSYDHPMDQNRDGFTDLSLQNRWSLFSKWRWEGEAGKTAESSLRFYQEDRWGGQLNWTPEFRGSDSIYGERIATRRWEWLGKYAFSTPLQFSWSYTGHHQDSYYGNTPFLADQHIAFGQLTWTKKRKNHHWLAGSAIRYTYLDDGTPATWDSQQNVNRPEHQFLPGIFIQDEWTIAPKHLLLIALRTDHHNRHGRILTPRLAWKWKLQEDFIIRWNAGSGFRIVNIFTEDHAALTGARSVWIREGIRPEQSWNLNLNLQKRWHAGPAQINADASAWFTHFSNRILPDYDTDPNKIIYSNLNGFAISRGVSVTIDWNVQKKFRGMLGSTLQDIFVQEASKSRIRPVLTERWSAVWMLSYSFPRKGLSLDYTGNVYGPMRMPLLGRLDPRPEWAPVWSIQNLQLSWKKNQMEVYGGIKNLLNWTPVRSVPFLIARAHDPFDKKVEVDPEGHIRSTPENPYALSFDPTYSFAANQGRRWFLGIRFHID
jgi:outer membrane receptor for ferrienterochelin and colicins